MHTEPNPIEDPTVQKNDPVIVKINGKTFYCECGCNVFHKPDADQPDLYECNACETWYRGA